MLTIHPKNWFPRSFNLLKLSANHIFCTNLKNIKVNIESSIGINRLIKAASLRV